jgi:hypothetical protein
MQIKGKFMKNLIMLLILIFSFSLNAQDKTDTGKEANQTEELMNKIAADPEMRSKMMNLMIAKTTGSKAEMQKLVNSFLDNPEMKKMIFAAGFTVNESEKISFQPRGIMSDSVSLKKTYKMEKTHANQ